MAATASNARTAPAWRWILLPVAAGLAVFYVGYWVGNNGDAAWTVVHALALFAAAIGGLIAWGRRPDSKVGILLLIWTLYALVGGIGARDSSGLFVLNWILTPLYWVVLAQLLLTYPDGRTRTRAERWFLGAAYATPALWFAMLPWAKTPWLIDCPADGCPANPMLISPSEHVVTALFWTAKPVVGALLVMSFVALVVARRRGMPPAERRSANPMLWAMIGPVGVFVFGQVLVLASVRSRGWIAAYHWAVPAAAFWVPAALVAGLYTATLARAGVGPMLVRLRSAAPGELQSALAELLRDPTLRIAVPSPESPSRYLDPAGCEIAAAESVQGPTVTQLGSGAVLLHHRSARDEDPALFAAAVAAAAVTLDNARLAAQVRAQLAEVTASRERLVRAADEERRKVERDLHDGAQQQLLGVGMALQSARLAIPQDSPAAPLLDEASGQLRSSLIELRALSRGLRPALLTERGLEAALGELRRRLPIPIEVTTKMHGRLDPAIETTAYYVVAEAIQNVTRHAAHAHVTVQVHARDTDLSILIEDDGPGGADPDRGSGLRGLADRVATVGGTFMVSSPAGAGTRIAVRLPLLGET